MILARLSLILVVGLTPWCANAAPDPVAVYGVGSTTCGALLTAYEEGPSNKGLKYGTREFYQKAAIYREWLSGYMTAWNALAQQGGNPGLGADMIGLESEIRKHCAEHPRDLVATAAAALVRSKSTNE